MEGRKFLWEILAKLKTAIGSGDTQCSSSAVWRHYEVVSMLRAIFLFYSSGAATIQFLWKSSYGEEIKRRYLRLGMPGAIRIDRARFYCRMASEYRSLYSFNRKLERCAKHQLPFDSASAKGFGMKSTSVLAANYFATAFSLEKICGVSFIRGSSLLYPGHALKNLIPATMVTS